MVTEVTIRQLIFNLQEVTGGEARYFQQLTNMLKALNRYHCFEFIVNTVFLVAHLR